MRTNFALENLRTKTCHLHKEVERSDCFAALTRPTLTVSSYSQALRCLGRLLERYEPSLLKHFPQKSRGYQYHPRLPLIVDDLKKLDVLLGQQVERSELSFHEAIGVSYVIEGSTMGGKVICKHLREITAIANVDAVSYFNFHKEATWARFLGWLTAQNFRANEIDAICTGAINAFNCLIDFSKSR